MRMFPPKGTSANSSRVVLATCWEKDGLILTALRRQRVYVQANLRPLVTSQPR